MTSRPGPPGVSSQALRPWKPARLGEPNPYQLEWDDLIAAIRADQPFNEVKRGVEASLVTSMGRMSAHTGRVVTFEEMLHCDHEFAPGLDKLTKEFLSFVVSEEGQKIVVKDGYFALPAELSNEALKTLAK